MIEKPQSFGEFLLLAIESWFMAVGLLLHVLVAVFMFSDHVETKQNGPAYDLRYHMFKSGEKCKCNQVLEICPDCQTIREWEEKRNKK